MANEMGKELVRKGGFTQRLKENIEKSDRAYAKKYGMTLEEYRRAKNRKNSKSQKVQQGQKRAGGKK